MSELLITAQQLAARLDQPNLRVFDATVHLRRSERGYQVNSGEEDYRTAHIPGAAFMNQPEALSDTTSKLGFTLPEVDALAAGMGALGISRDTSVVLYATSHVMWATRALWLLRYLGHTDVRVLDGGLDAWREAGLNLADGDESYPSAQFRPDVQPKVFVRLDEMKEIVEQGEACVVNALPEPVYTGAGGAVYGRAGHIPGSVSLPYDNLLKDGYFRPAEELRQALAATGMDAEGRVVAYCGGGISASIPAFARLLLALNDTAIYDGSMSEWVREGLPLNEGSDP